MAILKVARMGHPVLTTVADPVPLDALAEPALQAFIDDMLETMVDERGVGLAAPQVHRSLRIFVMDPPAPPGHGRPEPYVIVNPVLSFPQEGRIGLWEGCLSIPGIRGLTERWEVVLVECLDRHGQRQSFEFEGYAAAVVQHETDHLDGVLFLERMPDLSKLAFEDELARHDPRDDEDREEDEAEGEDDQDDGDEPRADADE
ncbi:MAG: peptide deformylase [Gemmatimonadota bacterium]|nr:MAG: peptide deformylase [Gemmatimonadota bacterium]